jgi:hypothetical protein
MKEQAAGIKLQQLDPSGQQQWEELPPPPREVAEKKSLKSSIPLSRLKPR